MMDLRDRIAKERNRSKQRYDARAHQLRSFPVGAKVRIQDPVSKRWDKTGIVQSRARTEPCSFDHVILGIGSGSVRRDLCDLEVLFNLVRSMERPNKHRTRFSSYEIEMYSANQIFNCHEETEGRQHVQGSRLGGVCLLLVQQY